MNKMNAKPYLYPLPLPYDIQTSIAEYIISKPKSLAEYYNLNHGIVNISMEHITEDVTSETIRHLRTFKRIVYLNLRYCRHVTDEALLSLKHLPLRYLSLFHCCRITDIGLLNLTKDKSVCQSTLQYINISGTKITDNTLYNLKTLPLRYLIMDNCYNITDHGLINLKSLPLIHLSLHYCMNITDGGMLYLKTLPLQYLDIGNTRVTDVGLMYLKDLQLEHLELLGCDITDRGIYYIQSITINAT